MEPTVIGWSQSDISGPELLQQLNSIVPARLNGSIPMIAAVMTLGLYMKDAGYPDWSLIAQEVAKIHPCRVIGIHPTSEGDSPVMDVDYSATVQPRSDGQSPLLFSEYLGLSLKGALSVYWIDLVQPLTRSDLPATLWWASDPPEPRFRWDLLATCFDHLLVDSAAPGLIEWLPALSQARAEGLQIDDLAWARILPWIFHWASIGDQAEGLAVIAEPEQISLHTPEWPSSEALLLLAWLAVQLEWALEFQDNTFYLILQSGSVIPVNIETSSDMSWTFARESSVLKSSREDGYLRSWLSFQDDVVSRWEEPMPSLPTVQVLLNIFNKGHDLLYDKVLDKLIRIGGTEHP